VLFYGDRQQNRPSLNVVEGNARPPRKLYGNIRKADVNDAAGTAWLEDFMIDRKDGSQPFEFKIQAVDGRGKRSSVWSAD
jgi:hypothetical protein